MLDALDVRVFVYACLHDVNNCCVKFIKRTHFTSVTPTISVEFFKAKLNKTKYLRTTVCVRYNIQCMVGMAHSTLRLNRFNRIYYRIRFSCHLRGNTIYLADISLENNLSNLPKCRIAKFLGAHQKQGMHKEVFSRKLNFHVHFIQKLL